MSFYTGGWSSWGAYGTCSVTCDAGLKSRSRACDNPDPSVTLLSSQGCLNLDGVTRSMSESMDATCTIADCPTGI